MLQGVPGIHYPLPSPSGDHAALMHHALGSGPLRKKGRESGSAGLPIRPPRASCWCNERDIVLQRLDGLGLGRGQSGPSRPDKRIVCCCQISVLGMSWEKRKDSPSSLAQEASPAQRLILTALFILVNERLLIYFVEYKAQVDHPKLDIRVLWVTIPLGTANHQQEPLPGVPLLWLQWVSTAWFSATNQWYHHWPFKAVRNHTLPPYIVSTIPDLVLIPSLILIYTLLPPAEWINQQ